METIVEIRTQDGEVIKTGYEGVIMISEMVVDTKWAVAFADGRIENYFKLERVITKKM